MLTTDPNDPRLGHGIDTEPVKQNETYLVLPEEKRKKFVRPVRQSYVHVGLEGPKYPLRDLTPEEHARYDQFHYVKFEKYPEGKGPTGRYWTQINLNNVEKGCRTVTKMALALAETYAANPCFYGSTYCCTCQKHLPVEEFVWEGTDERVGS